MTLASWALISDCEPSSSRGGALGVAAGGTTLANCGWVGAGAEPWASLGKADGATLARMAKAKVVAPREALFGDTGAEGGVTLAS
jgi:hypothetical protein